MACSRCWASSIESGAHAPLVIISPMLIPRTEHAVQEAEKAAAIDGCALPFHGLMRPRARSCSVENLPEQIGEFLALTFCNSLMRS